MTLGEIDRYLASRARVKKFEAQDKATYDYILAELIGRSIARLYSSSNKFPPIEEVYPTLFDSKAMVEMKKKRRDEATAIRFKQFAQSFNSRFKKKEEVANDKWQKN